MLFPMLQIGSPTRAFALLLIMLATPVAAQEWTIGAPANDDRKDIIGWIGNDEGHLLLMRWKEEKEVFSIFAELTLGNGKKFGTSVPGFQVGTGRPVDLDWQIGYGERNKRILAEVNGAVAFWSMWWDEERQIDAGMMIGQWIEGDEVTIMFTLSDGTAGSTRFRLAGLKEIIPLASGISIEDEPD